MNSMRDVEMASVKSVVSACNDYLQALSVLCNAGVTLVRHFVDPQSVSALVQPVRRDLASRARAAWEETGRATRNASWALRTGSLRSLEEWLSRQEEEEEEQEQTENKFGSDDCMRVLELSKLLNSCLSAVLQLQRQFSVMVAPPNGGKSTAVSQRQPPSPPNPRTNGPALLDPSSALHSRQHHHGHGHHHHHHHNQMATNSLAQLAAYNNFSQRRPSADDSNEEQDDDAVPPSAESLLMRRSSSPPPPPPGAALGRRWSVPGGDSALEEGWTREMQRRAGGHSSSRDQTVSTHPRQQLPPPSHPEGGRAILGTGRRHAKKKGGCPVTKEELDEVLLSLWGPPRTSTQVGSRHPLSVLLPPTQLGKAHDWLLPPPVASRSLHANAHRRGSWQGGLLTVTTSSSSPPPQAPISPLAASATTNGWAAAVHRPPPKPSPPRSPQPVSPTPAAAELALPSVQDASADTEGAFSIGLDLVGTSLVASVQQRGGDTEEKDGPSLSNADTNATEKYSGCEDASRPSGTELGPNGTWQPNRQQRQSPPASNAHTAAFLSFTADAANSGSTIWTPSSNDYASRPRGSYPYQIGP